MLRQIRSSVVFLLLGGAGTLVAQTGPRVDVAASFVAQRSIQTNTAANFWAEGGSLEVGADAFRGFGMAASVAGVHTAAIGSGDVPLSLVTAVFGPRFRWHNGHRISPFGEALLGEADGFRSVFPSASGADDSASSLALQVGGGVDLQLSRHLSARALQANWIRTQLPNGTNDRQNILRLGAGVVVRFGH